TRRRLLPRRGCRCYAAPPWKSVPCENACRSCRIGSRFSGGIFDIDGKKKRIAELDEQTAAEGFWNAADKAQIVLREQARLKSTVDGYEAQSRALEDAGVLIDLADEAKDEATAVEAGTTLSAIEEAVGKIEFARMLSGPYDRQGALVSVNAGAGGTESQDWAEMLLRMYARWAERKGYKIEELDRQPGDEAGIKSATIGVDGEWAYGGLRAEAGGHRLGRISPYDAQARRRGPARQQDRVGRAHHPYPDRHRRPLRRRALAAQEQVDRHAHPAVQAVRGRAEEAGREDGEHPRPEEGDRVGEPDPVLRPGAVPSGQRPPDGPQGRQRRRRSRRRPRSVHGGHAAGAGRRPDGRSEGRYEVGRGRGLAQSPNRHKSHICGLIRRIRGNSRAYSWGYC